MQIINFHDEELQCHVSVSTIEMIIKTKTCFSSWQSNHAQAVKAGLRAAAHLHLKSHTQKQHFFPPSTQK